jgi:hypothetical protein
MTCRWLCAWTVAALVSTGCLRETAGPAAQNGSGDAASPSSTGATPGATAPPASSSPVTRPTVSARIHPSLEAFTFTLIADGPAEPGGLLRVKAIEVRRGAETAPMQTIDGLDTQTPVPADGAVLGILDMNFDGYQDIRLVELQPAGPNVPYLNWLFDPASGRFQASPALNAIVAPTFDAATREIRSDWRDGPTRYGTDVYVFRDGAPVAVRRELKIYSAPGRYTQQLLRPKDGEWAVVEQRDGRDP